jgi:hypothetical protein
MHGTNPNARYMDVSRPSRRRGWAAAALLAVQLAAAIALPLAHAGAEDDALHVETPGTHQHGHNEAACPVCRMADGRFTAGVGMAAIRLSAAASPVDVVASVRVVIPRLLLPSLAARAPPHA